MRVKKEEWMGMKIIIIMNKNKFGILKKIIFIFDLKQGLFDFMYFINFLKINN